MELIVLAICLTVVVVVFLILNYCASKRSWDQQVAAWNTSMDIQRECWEQMNQERATSATLISDLTQWNTHLTQQCVCSAKREIEEVQRYMLAMQADMTKVIGDAASDVCGKVRGDTLKQAGIDSGAFPKLGSEK